MASSPPESEAPERAKEYDLLILVDATASMTIYLNSLRRSLPQIIALSNLTQCFAHIGLLAYRDYDCTRPVIEWSGWMQSSGEPGHDDGVQPDLVGMAGALMTSGGYSVPEAVKTGLAKAYDVARKNASTLVLLFADAPPHMHWETSRANMFDSNADEQKALTKDRLHGESPALFADWASAAHTLRNGGKDIQVVSVVDRHLRRDGRGYFPFLSTMTRGATIVLTDKSAANISVLTIAILLSWMGVEKSTAEQPTIAAEFHTYANHDDIESVESEEHKLAKRYFQIVDDCDAVMHDTLLTTVSMRQHLPKKTTPVQDFAKRYATDEAYREAVVKHLEHIIQMDVSTISLNPVFGSLWRALCNDRSNEHRQDLLDLFGRKVEAIDHPAEKQRMKTWLEESYDYTAEVLAKIASVPAHERFPCVCLDPTLTFVHAKAEGDSGSDDGDDDHAMSAFSRDDLLEIGRSCDQKILRRLGHVLTRFCFIESADTVPAHIAAVPDSALPKIPVALATQARGRDFWRILLHLVVPGTMLGSRAGALVAALAIRQGIRPLMFAAGQEMLFHRDRWNNIEVPETWSPACLSLLLDADAAWRSHDSLHGDFRDTEGLLRETDRWLFETLVDYKLLERNLETSLIAQVGWSPKGTMLPMGPVVVCKKCEFPRSVSIMGPDSVCGTCLSLSAEGEGDGKFNSVRVSASDNETTDAAWYECSVPSCRAQYIVYDVDGLRVRPKCHYCRQQGSGCMGASLQQVPSAPVVECKICLSRFIWPVEYRPTEDLDDWRCMGCESGRKTTVEVDATAQGLREGNGDDWLLRNAGGKIPVPFDKRSLYRCASSSMPLDDFSGRVEVLPGRRVPNLQLYHGGKLIRNSSQVLESLYSWVSKRRVEGGTCSLCFTDSQKFRLSPACGRSGCYQQICSSCLEGWYGLNRAGCLINTAALGCPFCRRAPTAKTLARYGMGIHAVGSLREAVAESGAWIYGWCAACGHAKPFMERVCATGTPEGIRDWVCDECGRGKAARNKVKPCPGCATPTEKIGGCDHIRCLVTGCYVHWCFFCGGQFDEKIIYAHMSKDHGGYFDGGNGDEWGEEDDMGVVD